ncbi:MAG TPA: hypothetical protein VIE17_01010 [Methylophilaceae bacterium]
MKKPAHVPTPAPVNEDEAVTATDRETEISQEISEALDAILAYAFTLDQDLPLTQKWPAFPPRRSEAERRGLDVFDSNRLNKQLNQRHANRINWKDQL